MIRTAEHEEELDSSWEAGLAAAEEAAAEESTEETAEADQPAEAVAEEETGQPEEESAEPTDEVEDQGEVEEEPQEEEAADESQDAPEVDKLEQLEALAKELGFEFNGEKVQNAHFVKLRQQAKVQRDKLEAKAQERIQQIEDAKAQLEARYKPFEELRAAAEIGDFDALAKAVGHDSFQAMAMAHVNRNTQEGAQRLKIQRELQELRAQQEANQKRYQQQQNQAQQAQARQQYVQHVAETLGGYKETQGWVNSPDILNAVVDVQAKSIGADGRPTMTIEEAAQNILAEAQKQRGTIDTLLGTSAKSGEEASNGASPKTAEKKKKTKTVSQRGRVEVGKNTDDDEFNHEEWVARSVAAFERAGQ